MKSNQKKTCAQYEHLSRIVMYHPNKIAFAPKKFVLKTSTLIQLNVIPMFNVVERKTSLSKKIEKFLSNAMLLHKYLLAKGKSS